MAKKKRRPAKGERFELMQILALVGVLFVLVGTVNWLHDSWTIPILALISVILAFTNIKKDEFQGFLLAAIALTVVSTLNFTELTIWGLGNLITRFLIYFKWLVAPATLILAVRELWKIMRD